LNKFRQQAFNIKFSIHFVLVWNEMQSSLPTETDARRNHDVLGELCSLSLPADIHQCFSSYPQTKHDHSDDSQVDSNKSFFLSVEKTVFAFASGR